MVIIAELCQATLLFGRVVLYMIGDAQRRLELEGRMTIHAIYEFVLHDGETIRGTYARYDDRTLLSGVPGLRSFILVFLG